MDRIQNSKTNFQCSILLILLLVSNSVPSVQSSPRCCEICTCTSNEVWCEQKGLSSVPSDIPVNTKRLYLFNNEISDIPNGAFAKLKSLEILDLRTNLLDNSAIKPGVFDGLENLQALLLSQNKLKLLASNTFTGIGNLVRLYLKDNLIESVENDALTNLTKLVELKLGNNRLTSVPKLINCRSLRRFYLNNNHITHLVSRSFASISDLEDLTLADNELREIPADAFGSASSLRILDLSENKFRHLPLIVRNMTSLHTLNMSGNPISSLPVDSFRKLLKIKALDLHGLRLTSLPKGVIPRRVYLNMFDVSKNPWTCNCDIQWMIEYMSNVPSVFTSIRNVQCAQPQRLKGRRLTSLTSNDDYCETASFVSSTIRPESNLPDRLPSKIPTVDLCDALACANGGVCYINKTSRMPACRCLPGWMGLLCNEVKPTSLMTRITTTPRATNNQPKLMIREHSTTSHSVEIFFPVVKKSMTITTTIIGSDGKPTEQPQSRKIFPTKNSYTVEGLEAGQRYNICITNHLYMMNTGNSVEDKLCNTVKTLPKTVIEQKDGPVKTTTQDLRDQDRSIENKEKVPKNEGVNSNNQKDLTSKDTDTLPIYIAIGVGAALVLLLLLSVIFYKRRKKSKRSNTNHSSEMPLRPCHPRMKEVPSSGIMQFDGRDDGQMQIMLPLMRHNGECFDTAGRQQNCVSCNAQTQRVTTPIQNESLGRSSNSDGSVYGVAQNKRDRCCSQGSGPRFSGPSDEMRNNLQHKGAVITASYRSPLNSRECGSTYGRQESQSSRAETYAESNFHEGNGQIGVVPVLTTATTVNQYHHGSIATTSFEQPTTYAYPMHSNSNSTSINGCHPELVRGQQIPPQHTPIKQLRYPDHSNLQYNDGLYNTSHLMQNQVNRPFLKTLAV